jgi:hypothetical protein
MDKSECYGVKLAEKTKIISTGWHLIVHIGGGFKVQLFMYSALVGGKSSTVIYHTYRKNKR